MKIPTKVTIECTADSYTTTVYVDDEVVSRRDRHRDDRRIRHRRQTLRHSGGLDVNEDYAALLDELEFICREYMGDDNALEVAACIRVGEIIETLRLVLKPSPAAVPDARLGNLIHVWDYENPEDGHWDNIEEYLSDTTPNVGEVVRLNVAMPLQDVEVEMLEVGKYGEPIRWEVRDVKTGALLAAAQKENS